MDAEAITLRLQQASDLADLRPEHRLDAKIDLRPEAITARLRLVSDLRELCRALRVAGEAVEESPPAAATTRLGAGQRP
jgi:hypothetical protein